MTDDPIDLLCVRDGNDRGTVERLEGADDRLSATVADGVEAAAAAVDGDRPDCLLVDGLADDAVRSLLSRARAAEPPVPFVLAGGSDDAVDAVLAADGTAVVSGRLADVRPDVVANRVATVVERRRGRTAAERRDRRLHALLESSSDRLSVLDEDGIYRFVSPAVERLMGYDPEELVGTSGFEYVHPDDRERVRAGFERVRDDDETSVALEYRVRDADGRWRWVESRGIDRFDDPVIGGMVVSSREITDRKERERDLERERAFSESIFAALPDVLYAFDADGRFLRWNDRLSEVTGYDDEEIASMRPTEFVAEEDREAVAAAITEVFEEDTTVTVEARFVTEDGERVPYEFTGARMTDEDGETLGLVGIGRDVSARKARRRRFEAVFDNTYQFTGLMEPDGTMIEANRTALEFAGVDRESVVGTKLWETPWFQTGEEARETAREAVERARNGELYRTELTVRGEEGTETVDFSVRPIRDDRGEVSLLVPEGRTITELKRRERHLKVLHRFLRHNLRNALTVIRGTAEHLLAAVDDPERADHVERIRDAARDLDELSETANDLWRTAVGDDPDREPVDVAAVLEGVVDDVAERYPSAAIDLDAGGASRVRADWRLGTALGELVENAVEHAGDGAAVEVTVTERDGRVAVRIADDGPGIPENELAGITTDEEPTQLTHGTGVGLWLVRWVVDDYGGDLAYESSAAGGSAITVELPAADARPPEVEAS